MINGLESFRQAPSFSLIFIIARLTSFRFLGLRRFNLAVCFHNLFTFLSTRAIWFIFNLKILLRLRRWTLTLIVISFDLRNWWVEVNFIWIWRQVLRRWKIGWITLSFQSLMSFYLRLFSWYNTLLRWCFSLINQIIF